MSPTGGAMTPMVSGKPVRKIKKTVKDVLKPDKKATKNYGARGGKRY